MDLECRECYRSTPPPEWVISVDGDSFKQEEDRPSELIYRVPWHIHRVNEDPYNPKIISIGPYHFGDPWLQSMEHHKRRFVLRLLHSSNNGVDDANQFVTIYTLTQAMSDMEKMVRDSYAELFPNIERDEFIRTLVWDGCFIIQLLLLFQKGEEDDLIFETRWLLPTLRDDMLLLENQLPYSVLQKIFELTWKGEVDPLEREKLLLKLIFNFYNRSSYLEKTTSSTPKHLLGLIHSSYISSQLHACSTASQMNVNLQVKPTLSAATLQGMGVMLRCKSDADLLDIDFKIDVLRIPPLLIDHSFITMVHNFIAYEQCSHKINSYFTSLAFFLDGLVNSPEDVEILCANKIISYAPGSREEIATLLNNLPRKVTYGGCNNYLSPLIQELEKLRPDDLRNWMCLLRRDNLPSVFAFVLTIVVLYLTLGQTLFSFLSYIHPHQN